MPHNPLSKPTPQSLSVDLTDPRARALLGLTDAPISAGTRREVVQIAGDAPAPGAMGPGISSTQHLTAGKQEVLVVFGDLLLTVDLYTLPGEPVKCHLICPRCHKQLQIQGDRKKIEFEPRSLNPIRPTLGNALAPEVARIADFGRLSIETFQCTWEMGDDLHVAGGVHTGASLCRLRLVIDNNRAREA